jgi:hypothetical protein
MVGSGCYFINDEQLEKQSTVMAWPHRTNEVGKSVEILH